MMNKTEKAQSIYGLPEYLKKEKILPVYFFFGEDYYSIDNAIKAVEKAVEPLILSDFDREILEGEQISNPAQIVDLASAFPFGSGKKLLIVKNFDKVNNKKEITNYISNSAEFTILVLAYYGKATDIKKEPFVTAQSKNFLFEAGKLNSQEYISWLIRIAEKIGLFLSPENAEVIIEIVGEDKTLLEMQLKKISDYLSGNGEVSFEIIKKITSSTKEYSIFDLQDALGKGDRANSLKIGFNLLEAGKEMVFINTMLIKFITILARSIELTKQKIPDKEAAKIIGVSWYYYINCKKAKFFLSDERLLKASRALFNADVAVKTTSTEEKTILMILITEMLK